MLNRRQTSFPKTPVSLPTSSRYRVHSAPPTAQGRIPLIGGRLPPIVKNKSTERYMDKPSTPDPEKVREVLNQRLAQVLAGPSSKLVQNQMSSDERPSNFTARRKSLIRSSAIGSEDMQLVLVDEEEMAMLRSINKSHYSSNPMSSKTGSFSSEALYKHEYEDKSTDEESEELALADLQLKSRRKLSMIRQEEQEVVEETGSRASEIHSRRQSGIKNMEDRLTGMRHETMRSSTKSGEILDDQISGLVYDKEFDCYYNPRTDSYYRLKSQSKSGEGPSLQLREI